MFKRLPIAYWVPLGVLAFFCFLILQEATFGIIVQWLAEQIASILHVSTAHMIAAISTYVVLAAMASASVYVAYMIGVQERKANPSSLCIDFSQHLSGCQVDTTFNGGIAATFFRILVRPPKGQVRLKCSGTLVDIMVPQDENKFFSLWSAERVPLTWATHTHPPVTVIDLDDDHGRFLDVFFTTANGTIGLATPGLLQPNSLLKQNIFGKPGTYVFCISIRDQGSAAQEVMIALHWTGNPATCTATRIFPRSEISPIFRLLGLGQS